MLPKPVHACGGTFCDAGPSAMPVDQTGENILFVVEDGHVEAHIQIQYDGDAESFAWVVPLTSIPELGVGSEQLFQNLLQSTVPRYGTSFVNECDDWGAGDDDGGEGGTGDDGGSQGGDGSGGGGGDPPPKPKIVYEDTVGAFDAVVLQGGTAGEVMNWLADNGYQQDPAAGPILEEYLAEDFLFAAFKLHGDAQTDQIHPVVIRYEGSEPCVPLRLTRIAAQDDMDVRVFFLSDGRAAPRNFLHVDPNPVQLDWSRGANNYKQVVSEAIDEAGGHAWVTEFAGSACAVDSTGLIGEDWEECEIDELAPTDVIDLLERQGFARCQETGCRFDHPLVLPLLREFLPAPPGVGEAEYYLCVGCFQKPGTYQAWDAAGFVTALKERIIDPARHARELLDRHDYITRLYTTISPEEMTVDPMFHINPALPDVGNRHLGLDRFRCDHDIYELEDGREVYVEADWPELSMPFAQRIEMIPAAGAPQVMVDNAELIDDAVMAHDIANGYIWDGVVDGTGATGPVCLPEGGDITQPRCEDRPSHPAARGCGCNADGSDSRWLGVTTLALLGLRRRRRASAR